MKKILKRYIGNKYILTLAVFFTWLIFFDNANIVDWLNKMNDIKNKQNEKKYYQKEIERIDASIKELDENNESLEKYARENLYFKNEDEDVYIIEEESDE